MVQGKTRPELDADRTLLWQIIRDDLPPLIAQLEQILKP